MQTTTIAQSSAAVQTPAGIAPQTWIAAVHAETVRLKTSSRNLGKRLDDAQDLVLGGAVTRDADGLWQVESRTSPGVLWQVDGSCSCPDAEHAAPDGLCAHRLAVGITRRALKAVQSTAVHDESCTTAPQHSGSTLPLPVRCPAGAAMESLATALASAHLPVSQTATLPEAMFSLTIEGAVGGNKVLLTARGQCWDEFQTNVARVRGMLDAPGIASPAGVSGPESAPHAEAPPTCPTHGPMKPSAKAPGSFFCTKKLYNGSYCTSRYPEKD